METREEILAKAIAERDKLNVVIAYLSDDESDTPGSSQPTPQPVGAAQPRVDRATGKVDPVSLVAEAEFLGLSGPAAAIKVLEKVGRPNALRTTVLVSAVRKGGVSVSSAPVLYRSMIRNKKLQKVGKGLWGLSEWYPASSRQTTSAGTLPPAFDAFDARATRTNGGTPDPEAEEPPDVDA